jgi:hypothetical protein
MWKKIHKYVGFAALVAFLLLACTGCTGQRQSSNQSKICANHGGPKKVAQRRIDLGTPYKIEFVTTYFVCGDGRVESIHMLTAQPNI